MLDVEGGSSVKRVVESLESYIAVCPSCLKKTLVITEFIYEIPFFGRVLITTGKCPGCNYKFSDILSLEEHEPTRFTVKVSEVEDLNALVIRSKTASIRIPELGIEISPGPAAQPYITTIEGVLYKTLDVAESYCEDKDSPEYKRAVDNIRRAIRGELEFTFILEDPCGNSGIVHRRPERVVVERIES